MQKRFSSTLPIDFWMSSGFPNEIDETLARARARAVRRLPQLFPAAHFAL